MIASSPAVINLPSLPDTGMGDNLISSYAATTANPKKYMGKPIALIKRLHSISIRLPQYIY